mmetsp:Transcript_8623/g.11913  ORF Transcript_8623/g.11913 Transcript_8623/m.11913 type:complete len:135 (-) Transcript_8623:256-660(-)
MSHQSHYGPTLLSILLITPWHAGQISNDECEILNKVLGSKAPSGCFARGHNQKDDAFTIPSKQPFVGEDEEKHRNSWLWPKMARRLTRQSPVHVSQWRKPVEVDSSECEAIRKALTEKLGASEANSKLPQACKP